MKHCKHCPECAEEMQWKGFYYYCENCGLTQFPYPAFISIAVIAAITAVVTLI